MGKERNFEDKLGKSYAVGISNTVIDTEKVH